MVYPVSQLKGTQGKGKTILGVRRGAEGLQPYVEEWRNFRIREGSKGGLAAFVKEVEAQDTSWC